MSTEPKKIRKTAKGLIIFISAWGAFALIVALTDFWFGSALTQKEPVSTSKIVLAATRLEAMRLDVIEIDENGHWLKRAYKHGVFQIKNDALDKLLRNAGWIRAEQSGTSRVYVNNGDTKTVDCQMYSRQYQLCSEVEPVDEANN